MPKSIFITLNGKKVAIEIDDELGLFPDAKILPAYSKHCYETNACDACKDDKTGETCLNIVYPCPKCEYCNKDKTWETTRYIKGNTFFKKDACIECYGNSDMGFEWGYFDKDK
jgi:hypothetical protein